MISFIIPLHNHLAETQVMLSSLYDFMPSSVEYEIIFVDDASVDGTSEWLQSLSDARIKILTNNVNHGYAYSNNFGVKVANGELLVLLNNDLILTPGWLEPMLAGLHSPALRAGLVGNVQHRVSDGVVDHAGVILSPRGQLFHERIIPHNPYVQSFAVTGACMLLRKADYMAVGGFDEAFVNGCEDIDLCFKFQADNKMVYLANNSRIHHHVSLSRKTNTLQNIKNSRLLFSRWRDKLKNELSRVWRDLLATGPSAYTDIWSEPIAPEFLATPWALSLFMAETMIKREEDHWARMLDDGVASNSQLQPTRLALTIPIE